MKIWKTVTFEAAHFLPNVPKGHKCGRLHGHSYEVTIFVEGPLDPKMGWVVDYADIKAAWDVLHDQLDHRNLNEVPGLENSTAELLAKWIWDRLKSALPGLCEVRVFETESAGVVYKGE